MLVALQTSPAPFVKYSASDSTFGLAVNKNSNTFISLFTKLSQRH